MGYTSNTKSLSNKIPSKSKQMEPTPNTVKNNAGGYVFKMNKWEQLDRFLILGSESPTYYCSEKKMTLDNAKNVLECIREDGGRVVDAVVNISVEGRAPKNTSALFVLALCASEGSAEVKKYALDNLSEVARIGTHLFQFAQFVNAFRGWGSGLRKSIGRWYTDKDVSQLAYQIIKYPGRVTEEGVPSSRWTHKDLLRKSHCTGSELHNLVFDYVTKEKLPKDIPAPLNIIWATEEIKNCKDVTKCVQLIRDYRLPHEVIPKELSNDPDIWRALLPNLKYNALVRTLNRLTAYGVLKPFSSEVNFVCEILTNPDEIRKSRIHPVNILNALNTYNDGKGVKGSLTWSPNPKIVEALNEAFYLSFKNIEPSNKNILIALDVSGSMGMGRISGLDGLTPRAASAAMSMVTCRTEPNYYVTGFTNKLTPISINPKMLLPDVIRVLSGLPFGSTDCAQPMIYATENKLEVDAFVVYTDNETWAGSIKPHEALNDYRQRTGRNSKLIVVGMTATEFSIGDPNDKGTLNVVGFDSAAPQLISDFIKKD